MTISTIGFIGLGVMGEAMCRNLARKGGWTVVGYDTRPEPVARLKADGVAPAASLADAVTRADVLLMCLPGGKEVEAVAQGQGGDAGDVPGAHCLHTVQRSKRPAASHQRQFPAQAIRADSDAQP